MPEEWRTQVWSCSEWRSKRVNRTGHVNIELVLVVRTFRSSPVAATRSDLTVCICNGRYRSVSHLSPQSLMIQTSSWRVVWGRSIAFIRSWNFSYLTNDCRGWLKFDFFPFSLSHRNLPIFLREMFTYLTWSCSYLVSSEVFHSSEVGTYGLCLWLV
jgi:hypothetical protein